MSVQQRQRNVACTGRSLRQLQGVLRANVCLLLAAYSLRVVLYMCAFSVDDRSLVLAVMRGTRRVLGSAPPRQFETPIELVCFVSQV